MIGVDPFESDLPFFSRERVKKALEDIATRVLGLGESSTAKISTQLPRLNIYCGAGVTIDRSGLDWRRMVDGLLVQYVPKKRDRRDIFDAHDVLGAASLCLAHYRQDYDKEHYTMRVADRLRLLLYGNTDWNSGRLAEEVINLCRTCRRVSHDIAGGGYVVATPNYDTFLAEKIQKLNPRGLIYTTGKDNQDVLHEQKKGCSPGAPEWVDRKDLISDLYDPGAIIQLHGLIPRDGSLLDGRVVTPVIDELDYIYSEPYTFRVLEALFKQAPTIFVGTSLQDRPVLQALVATTGNADDYPRYLLSTLGNNLAVDPARRRMLRQNSAERYNRFKVTPIYLDYHFQAPTFLSELSRAICSFYKELHKTQPVDTELANGLALNSIGTYDSRLADWAKRWISWHRNDKNSLIQGILDYVIEDVRAQLDIKDSEVLKAELWVRDKPQEYRGLRLWESTVSRQIQEESARRALFDSNSSVSAVRAFQEGRPRLTYLKDDEYPHQRWRTYLAIPLITIKDGSDGLDRLPVGVIVIASMRSQQASGLYLMHKRSSLKDLLDKLYQVGQLLVSDSGTDSLDIKSFTNGATIDNDSTREIDEGN